jgi:ferredoxin
VRGTVSDRLTLEQQGLPVEMRDMDLDVQLILPEALQGYQWRVFRVIAPAGLDPALPLNFQLHVTRSKGIVYPELVRKDFEWRYEAPSDYVIAPEEDQKTWKTIWRERVWELAALGAGLVLLVWALRQPAWLMHHPQRLKVFRIGYLLYTLCFIGWFAQGQLSIVNFTGVIQSLLAGRGLSFLLYDPMTVSLWAFVIITLVVWGRGTFCGWLCPFGALQELVALLTQRLGLKWRLVAWQTDQRLKQLKYALWIGLMISACLSVGVTDRLVEVEPFKTSITLVFVREWPFVVWALGAVLVSTVYFKAYCRYVCPFGAGLGVLAWLRRRAWIERRQECGQPCQRCRHDCAYQAIDRQGAVNYRECFQCFDCVTIFESDTLCVPRIQEHRKGVIPIVAQKENKQ